MYVRRNVLLKAVVDEVEERVYHSSIGEDTADKGEVEDEIPELQVCALLVPRSDELVFLLRPCQARSGLGEIYT